MDEPRFWELIDMARDRASKQKRRIEEVLHDELLALPVEDIQGFQRIFERLYNAAYTWDLWGAAYVMDGSCSDDGFAYFRAGLIACGHDCYKAALRNPDSMADMPSYVDSNEEMLYVAHRAYEDVTSEPMTELTRDGKPEPPSGMPFDQDDTAALAKRYPKLWAKYGW